ncbi:sigma-70 family RNA polymerase sigma factor [Nocardia thailandica]
MPQTLTVSADPISDYLTTIGRTALLTPEEEHALAECVAAGAEARRALDESAAAGTALGAQERRALLRAEAEGRRAADHMVRANLRLVVSIARRFPTDAGLSLLDLVQEGTVGLIRAVAKFDPRRGVKLSTYATYWIRQAIGRALSEQGRTIRLPAHVAEVLHRLIRTRVRLEQELGRPASAAELAAALELPVERVDALLRHEQRPASLHTTVGEDGELGDLIADPAPGPAERVAEAMLPDRVAAALSVLTEREAQVIRLRFGLEEGEARTLDEIGGRLGVSRERIRQIEAKAMTKLRRPTCTRALADLLD